MVDVVLYLHLKPLKIFSLSFTLVEKNRQNEQKNIVLPAKNLGLPTQGLKIRYI